MYIRFCYSAQANSLFLPAVSGAFDCDGQTSAVAGLDDAISEGGYFTILSSGKKQQEEDDNKEQNDTPSNTPSMLPYDV